VLRKNFSGDISGTETELRDCFPGRRNGFTNNPEKRLAPNRNSKEG
jgi:hypothetical protein